MFIAAFLFQGLCKSDFRGFVFPLMELFDAFGDEILGPKRRPKDEKNNNAGARHLCLCQPRIENQDPLNDRHRPKPSRDHCSGDAAARPIAGS